uniref:PorV/PorQ family protein n=1 Tax=Eiseniibacteriota bacterium TaxID=2212470 RepID=A0A832MK00_UNCEI
MERRIAVRAAAAVVALAAVTAAGPAAAQSKAGTTIGQFLLIEPSARVAAMGNAGVTLFDGVDALYYNPAAAAAVERASVVFSHSEWIADIDHDYIALALPFRTWGTFFGSVTSLGSGEMDVRTVDFPLGTGERFTVSNLALGVGYAREITDRFAVGGQANWLQETIWHNSLSAATLSIGTLYRVSANGLHLGSSLTHFGTNGRFDGRGLRISYDADPDRYGDNSQLPAVQYTDAFDVPVLFRVGVGMPIRLGRDARLRLAADAFHPSDDEESVSLGAELGYREVVAVRGGYQSLFLDGSETGLTAGIGVRGEIQDAAYRVDYAWADHGRLGDVHRLSFGVAFGGSGP